MSNVMGDITSPIVKREPNLAYTYPPQPFDTTPSSISNNFPAAPSSTKVKKQSSRSPSHNGSSETPVQHEKTRRQRTTAPKQISGRGAIPTMPHLLPGEEITYTPTTHRISKAKKGKKVHNCTFPGCPKVCGDSGKQRDNLC